MAAAQIGSNGYKGEVLKCLFHGSTAHCTPVCMHLWYSPVACSEPRRTGFCQETQARAWPDHATATDGLSLCTGGPPGRLTWRVPQSTPAARGELQHTRSLRKPGDAAPLWRGRPSLCANPAWAALRGTRQGAPLATPAAQTLRRRRPLSSEHPSLQPFTHGCKTRRQA